MDTGTQHVAGLDPVDHAELLEHSQQVVDRGPRQSEQPHERPRTHRPVGGRQLPQDRHGPAQSGDLGAHVSHPSASYASR